MEKQWLTAIDHVTFAVKPETIENWLWLYTEVMGGEFSLRVDDVDQTGKSSMMLWTINFGNFGIALVAGIDRQEKSHVTSFVEKHGDHSPQHVAFKVEDLRKFLERMNGLSMRTQGEIQVRKDDRGWIKQVFAAGYHDESNPSEVGFHEYVQRPKNKKDAETSFSAKFGTNLYKQAQDAMNEDKRDSMADIFKHKPSGWKPLKARNEK